MHLLFCLHSVLQQMVNLLERLRRSDRPFDSELGKTKKRWRAVGDALSDLTCPRLVFYVCKYVPGCEKFWRWNSPMRFALQRMVMGLTLSNEYVCINEPL